MRLKFWGTRSVYPIASEESIVYGGDTLCLEVRSQTNALVIVDAGTGIRSLGNMLFRESFAKGQGTTSLLLSNTHWSHLLGFPFCGPMYVKGNQVTISASLSAEQQKALFEELTYEPFFPVALSQMGASLSFVDIHQEPRTCFEDITIESFTLPTHRAAYAIQEDDTRLVVLPTLSSWDELSVVLQERLASCDCLLLDAAFFLQHPMQEKELRARTKATTILYGYPPTLLDAALSTQELSAGILLAREGDEHLLTRETP